MKHKIATVSASPSVDPPFFSTQISHARRFYRHVSPKGSQAISVVSGGCEHCAADYHIHRGTFPYYSVEFVAQGQGLLTIAGRKHRLVPGAVFAYGPRVPHDIRAAYGGTLVKYFVDFAGRDARGLLTAPRPGEVLQTAAPHELATVFDQLIDAGLRHSPQSDRVCSHLVQLMLLRLAETAVPLGAIENPAFASYQRCREYIAGHFLELRGLAEIADGCHLDPAYVCRLFARYDHQTPYQFLTRLKMHAAAERLLGPDTLVKQAAADLHFRDAFQFSRTFRRTFGLSPQQFARLHPPH